MTQSLPADVPTSSEGRDDRTRRALALVVGAERADISLSHFATSCVEVRVAAETLSASNGMLATIATLNMLSRFIGIVELRVVGATTVAHDTALDAAMVRLQRIDTRTGRTVRRADGGSFGQASARIWVGETEQTMAGRAANDHESDVHVAFDGWTCVLRRGMPAGPIISSGIPFGALAAACFAVAEVFKTLIGASVRDEDAIAFRRRLVHEWSFSTWSMERLPNETATWAAPVDPMVALQVDGVLQVGAGAVGNAAALAFKSTDAVRGDLAVIDLKLIDEKNLNRCFYFAEGDISDPKVEVLEREATRAGFRVCGRREGFSADAMRNASIILSTVDNNEVRHRMQEALPGVLVEGATGGTTVAVAVHRPGDGRSCLLCRHPDRELGLTHRVPLCVEDAAAITGLTETEVALGQVRGGTAITDEVITRVSTQSPTAAAALRRAQADGRDLCGALGDLRAQLGTIRGPSEASVPFVSNLAGVLAAAEVVKLLLRAAGHPDVPVLDNVFQIDLARDYSRHDRLAYQEPPRADCSLCQGRAAVVEQVYRNRAVTSLPRAPEAAA